MIVPKNKHTKFKQQIADLAFEVLKKNGTPMTSYHICSAIRDSRRFRRTKYDITPMELSKILKWYNRDKIKKKFALAYSCPRTGKYILHYYLEDFEFPKSNIKRPWLYNRMQEEADILLNWYKDDRKL